MWGVMLCGDIDLGQHWLWQWLVAWWQQAIDWTNVDFPLVRFCGIHQRIISQWVTKLLFCIMSFKIILLKLHPQLLGVNELIFPWGTFIFPQNYLPPWMTISSSNYWIFEIHWVRLYLINLAGLVGIVNTTIYKLHNWQWPYGQEIN